MTSKISSCFGLVSSTPIHIYKVYDGTQACLIDGWIMSLRIVQLMQYVSQSASQYTKIIFCPGYSDII